MQLAPIWSQAGRRMCFATANYSSSWCRHRDRAVLCGVLCSAVQCLLCSLHGMQEFEKELKEAAATDDEEPKKVAPAAEKKEDKA